MKRAIILMALFCLSGCAGLMTGKYPFPTGVEVVPEKKQMAKISTEEFEVFQEIEGYTPDFVLIGIIVPFIPIGQWKWLSGIGKDDLRITVNLWVKPKAEQAQFDAAALQIVVNGRKYSPSEVRMSNMCGFEKGSTVVDLSGPVTVDKEVCIWFKFASLPPPDTSFSVVAKGLPSVTYVLERKTRYDFLRQ
jgi:hypothetical protein